MKIRYGRANRTPRAAGGKKRLLSFRNSAIAVFCLVLLFGLALPNNVMELWQRNFAGKPVAQSILPAESVVYSQDSLAAPSEQLGSTGDIADAPAVREIASENTEERTAFSKTFANTDGTNTLRYSSVQLNYRDGEQWKEVDNTLKAADGTSRTQPNLTLEGITNLGSGIQTGAFEGKAGLIKATMRPLSEGIGLEFEGKSITVRPEGAKNIAATKVDDRTVIYKDAWPNVDLKYELRGEMVKELIIVKSRDAQSAFNFIVDGAKILTHPTREGELAIQGVDPNEFSFSSLTLDVYGKGITSEERVRQEPTNGGIRVTLDEQWLKEQSSTSFPMVIDPSLYRYNWDSSGIILKSDGYSCSPVNCPFNTGNLYDNGWKAWRTYFTFDYATLSGKRVLYANLGMPMLTGTGGYTGNRQVKLGRATCLTYHCIGWSDPMGEATVGTYANINFTNTLQNRVTANDMSSWFGLVGEEGSGVTSYKPFYEMHIDIEYDTPTPVAQAIEPMDAQVLVTKQPTLRVNPVVDADGEAVSYQFYLGTGSDAYSGLVMSSGWISGPQWVIPDNILQDGTTYYWRVSTRGSQYMIPSESNWVRSFKVDLRTGKDSTQTYESVGPVDVALATGNVTTSASTHDISALGGSIGLNLTYNTPTQAKRGLTGKYWNVATNYSINSGAPTTSPQYMSNDDRVNFDWVAGSPGSGVANDWFYAQWTGNFIAPSTGSYLFGADIDGAARVYVNSQEVYNNQGGCNCTDDFSSSSSISLNIGQVVPIRVEFLEGTGNARMELLVKNAVEQQAVKSDWLRTEVVPSLTQYGLTGRYYTDDGTHTFPSNSADPNRLMMARNDSKVAFNWGAGAVASGLRTDQFMARWSGFVTLPSGGSFKLGARADDGVRITVGGTQVLNSWQVQDTTVWGSAYSFTSGQAYPITVEYFENTGNASLILLIKESSNGTAGYQRELEIPVTWLTPQAIALPNGWNFGADVDGNIAYDRLRQAGNNIILEDSTGSTHEYVWTGSGYKPPAGEDGTLTRTNGNTFTMTAADGRTYVFNAEGRLQSVTSPTDDKAPASLRYEYSGDPSRLTKIIDGVDNSRFGTLHYKGVNESGNCSTPSGFDDVPAGMLCAFSTSNNEVTKFYYKAGQLSRIERPGAEKVDYGYDTIGRLSTLRDVLANDAIATATRDDDDELLTELTYDQLGRASTITAPAATDGATRIVDSLEYLPWATQLHTQGSSEPNGFSRRIEYDHLLRTTKDTDRAGLVTTTEWYWKKDLLLSTTDPTGLKSTTIYDANDMPIQQYGPAPAGWYTSWKNRLTNGQQLNVGESMKSLDGRFTLTLQTNGNLVMRDAANNAIWTSGTNGQTVTHLIMQPNGNLVIRNGSSAVWNSQTNNTLDPTAYLLITDFGNAVVLGDNGARILWNSNTGPGEVPVDSTYNKPLSTYANQIPRADTNYDEGFIGAQVAWYNFKNDNLSGAPRLHATGFNPSDPSRFWMNTTNQSSPTVPIQPNDGASNVGFRATGRILVSNSGTYDLGLWHANAARVWLDGNLVLDGWAYRSNTVSEKHASVSLMGGKPTKVVVEYANVGGGDTAFGLELSGNGVSTPNRTWGSVMRPDYRLITSSKTYDIQLGNNTANITYSNPEYGLVSKTATDPTALNLENTSVYETPGNGFMRQTSSSLPGGTTTSYQYYGATETRDNPCTVANEAFKQAGREKLRTEADPDGGGSQSARTHETIYDDAGRVVAMRYNADSWTCQTYDSRGRLVEVVQPTINGRPGRTVETQYSADNNPFKSRTIDSVAGTSEGVIDLLGRAVSSTDVWGYDYTVSYDGFGNITQKTGPVGTETYVYDNLYRLTGYTLDSTLLASITYDGYGRVDAVVYPEAKDGSNNPLELTQVKRDNLGRMTGAIYQTSDGKEFDETVVLSQLGKVISATQEYDSQTLSSQFTYDGAGRLTSGTVGQTKFEYGYGAPDSATCNSNPGNNTLAHKNSNRTSYKVTNLATSTVMLSDKLCYDMADKLIYSTDVNIGTPTYDDHGNTISFSGNGTPLEFEYDAADYNIAVKQGNARTQYTKTANGSVLRKKEYTSNTLSQSYRYVSSGRILQTCSLSDDASCATVDRYISLPGNVTLTLSPSNTNPDRQAVYSLHNYHGDTALSLTGEGLAAGGTNTLLAYGPFGESLVPNTTGSTAQGQLNASDSSMGWAADPARKQDTRYTSRFVQMGARIYVPSLGRFLQVDPVQGGTLNAYVYAHDPVNLEDYSGRAFWFIPLIIAAVRAVAAVTPAIVAAVKAAAPAASKAAQGGSAVIKTSGKPASQGTKVVNSGKAAQAGRRADRSGANAGVYEFTGSSGKQYIGKSVDTSVRLQQHTRTGKYQGGPIQETRMPYATNRDLRTMEQTKINQSGGVGNLENKINSVRPDLWDDWGIPGLR